MKHSMEEDNQSAADPLRLSLEVSDEEHSSRIMAKHDKALCSVEPSLPFLATSARSATLVQQPRRSKRRVHSRAQVAASLTLVQREIIPLNTSPPSHPARHAHRSVHTHEHSRIYPTRKPTN